MLDASSKTTSYEYYVNGKLKKITDPLLRTTTLTYDRKDQLITEKDALNNTTTYKYDALGNVIKKTNPNGSAIDYKYDAGDRLTGEGSVTFAYNADNRRTSMVDSTGTTNYTYDSLGQLTLVDQPGTSAADFSYTYDAAGRITSRGFIGSGDRTVHYGYLPGGLLGLARAPYMYPGTTVTSYVYDAAGRPTLTTLPNGTTAGYSYDNAGRLTLVENKTSTGMVISRHAYTLDGAGNRTAADEDNGATLDGITNYTYDNLSRLTEAVYPDNQQVSYRRATYAYNDSGDRTTLEKWTGTPGNWTQYGTTASYTYDGAGRMTAAAGVNYCYDANGNQTRRNGSNCSTGGDVFTWDAWNRLGTANISGGSNTTYTYNGDGVRTKKTVGSTITEYYQDVASGLPRVAADKSGTIWNYYVYGNELIGKVGSDNVARYYHYDGTGHVRAITDSTGAVVERYDYDAFGTLRNTPTGLANDRRFTGEQHDSETAYTFLRARYNDPALGRFISKDPFDGVKNDPQSLNGFTYVGNNPVNLTDPSGKCVPWCVAALALMAVEAFTPFSLFDLTGAALAATSGGDLEFVQPGQEGSIGAVEVLEASGPAGWISENLLGNPDAFTVGHFYFSADDTIRDDTAQHELGHVKQFENDGDLFWLRYARDPIRMEHEADQLAGTCVYGCPE